MIYRLIKIEVLNLIDNKQLDYDVIRHLTPGKLAELIPHVIRENVGINENILIPCDRKMRVDDYSRDKYQCEGNKLKVPPTFLEFLEILLYEMKDPNFVNSSLRNIIINGLDFEYCSGETIDLQ